MRVVFVLSMAGALLGAGDVARAQTSTPTLPSTRPATIAAAWLKAFNAGEKEPLREFFAAWADAASLAADPADARAERLVATRTHLGKLTLDSVLLADANSIAVRVRASAVSMSLAVRFVLATTPPNKLIQLEIAAMTSAGGSVPALPAARPTSSVSHQLGAVRRPSRTDDPIDSLVLAGDSSTFPLTTEAVVSVVVNDRVWRFLLDTGASGVWLSPAVRDFAGAIEIAKEPEGPVVRVDSLRVGAIRFYGLNALTTTLPPGVDGVLGLAAFRSVQLRIDFAGGTATLSRDSLNWNETGVMTYRAFRTGSPLMVVPMVLGGRPTEGVLDTGSSFAFIVPTSLADSLSWSDRRPGPRIGGPGVVAQQAEFGRLTDGARVAGQPVANADALIANVRLTDSASVPVVNIGRPSIRGFVMTINQRQRRVKLVSRAHPGAD